MSRLVRHQHPGYLLETPGRSQFLRVARDALVQRARARVARPIDPAAWRNGVSTAHPANNARRRRRSVISEPGRYGERTSTRGSRRTLTPLAKAGHPLSALYAMENVILFPHLAFFTREAMRRLEDETLERCVEILEGRPVLVKSRDPRLRSQRRGVRFAD